MNEENNRAFFSPLRSHYDALFMVRDTSSAFLVIAGMMFLMGLFSGTYTVLIEATLCAIAAMVLRRWQSRGAAVLLLAFSTASFLVFIAARAGLISAPPVGSVGIVFMLVGLWAGARAVEATFKLRGSLSANSSVSTTNDA